MITDEQSEVLSHTARTGRYVTGDKSVIEMAEAGLLLDHGPQTLAGGDHYFTITHAGVDALQEWRSAQPIRKPLTKPQERYRQWLRADIGISFIEWLKRAARKTKNP